MNALFDYPLITALGWSLLHSCWIFLVIWIIGRGGLALFKSPEARYHWLLGHVALFPVSFGVLLYCFWPARNTIVFDINLPTNVEITLATGTSSPPTIWGMLDWALPYLAIFYGIGLLISVSQSLLEYQVLRQLRIKNNRPFGASWNKKFERLKNKMDVRDSVLWLQSSHTPTVLSFGIIKPVILFPIGLINQLSEEEVEALLLHELAHIRRHDFLINTIQQAIQSLFFYHPAIYALNKEVKQIREYCCDDEVIRRTELSTYSRSLLHTAQFSLTAQNQFAMYASHDQSKLTDRIKRLYGASSPTKKSSGLLVLLLFIVPLFIAAFPLDLKDENTVKQQTELTETLPEVTELRPVLRDTTPPVKKKVIQKKITTDNGEEETEEIVIFIDEEEVDVDSYENLDHDAIQVFVLEDEEENGEKKMRIRVTTNGEYQTEDGIRIIVNDEEVNWDGLLEKVPESIENIDVNSEINVEVHSLEDGGKEVKIIQMPGGGIEVLESGKAVCDTAKLGKEMHKNIIVRTDGDGSDQEIQIIQHNDEKPLIIINGEEVTEEELLDINPALIQQIEVIKNEKSLFIEDLDEHGDREVIIIKKEVEKEKTKKEKKAEKRKAKKKKKEGQAEIEAAFIDISSLYPNPADDRLQVLGSSKTDQYVSFSITDVEGRNLKTQYQSLSSGEDFNVSIDISQLVHGHYFLVAKHENQTVSRAFVKE